MTLDDLSAGSYEFTSYHFANDLSTGNSGIADISLNGVDTGLNATLEVANPPGLTIPAADVEAGNRTISFTVANDNDTVTILYDNLDGNGGGNSFGLNGFELAVAPEPSTFPLTITPNASNPGNYDFSWDSQAGKTYDLVSETGLSTSIATWPVWMGNADIPSSGTGMNTLTDVAGGGDTKRFFAVIEKDP